MVQYCCAFFGLKCCPFSFLNTLLSFPVCWHIECEPLTASSFRIWYVWKFHVSCLYCDASLRPFFYSRMSALVVVRNHSYLVWEDLLCQTSSVASCPTSISSASVGSLPFFPLLLSLCMKCSLEVLLLKISFVLCC